MAPSPVFDTIMSFAAAPFTSRFASVPLATNRRASAMPWSYVPLAVLRTSTINRVAPAFVTSAICVLT